MKRYIDLNWNIVEVENLFWLNVKLIDWTYFEQEKTPVKTETKIEKKEEIIESKENVNIEDAAKEFLKEKKVKGYGLLKWEKLIEKAKELWFEW